MKKDLTELIFILDRSGSMSGLESDTIGGFNSLLQKQRKEPGDCIVTTVLFDDKYELLHDRLSLAGVADLTDRDYYVRGTTALLDAVGRTIAKTDNARRHTAESERAEKVVMVITTDGMENASREYSYSKIKKMIEQKKEEGWEFLFLGANIDAVETASRFGIGADRAANYHADSVGTALNFEVVSEAVAELRENAVLPKAWKQRIDQDYKARKA